MAILLFNNAVEDARHLTLYILSDIIYWSYSVGFCGAVTTPLDTASTLVGSVCRQFILMILESVMMEKERNHAAYVYLAL